MANVHLITIGDELLIGQVIDSNSAFIAKELTKHGFHVGEITSVSDQQQHIIKTLKKASKKADIVIITGGLGPTKDDITKQAMADFFGCDMAMNQTVWQHIQYWFTEVLGRTPNDLNKQQALLPSISEALPNPIGTAPGIYTQFNNTIYVNLPGVPTEMRKLTTQQLIPRLKAKYKTPFILQRNILVMGIPESELAMLLEEWEHTINQNNIQYAYLPSGSRVRIRLTATGKHEHDLNASLDNAIAQLQSIIPNNIISVKGNNIIELILQEFQKKKLTLSTAESCTGGNLAKKITSISGASSIFNGSLIAYQTKIKQQYLDVSTTDLKQHTVVSKQVALQMAKGGKKLFNTDVCIATTGVAGPKQGEDNRPVGTIAIAIVANNGVEIVKEYNYPGLERQDWIEKTTDTALNLLYQLIKS